MKNPFYKKCKTNLVSETKRPIKIFDRTKVC